MYKEEDVQEKIGYENLKAIRQSIKKGEIQVAQLRSMAKKMKGTTLGVFTQKMHDRESPVDVFNFMLDTWYEEELCKPGVDGLLALKHILSDEEVGQHSLALKMVYGK